MKRGRPAARVAAGILLTRMLGLVRERVFAHYFGSGYEADAFRAALKIPNVVRNLLGEGTLSASFIPVYAGLIERKEEDAARRVAGALATLIVLAGAVAALLGSALAPIITDIAAPGFSGQTRDLTVSLVRILFPMSSVMIASAWCLGVLNTHRQFFLSYAAPTLWNIAQIATLVIFGSMMAGADLAVALAWGALAGSGLQLIVQLPSAFKLAGRLSPQLGLEDQNVRRVIWAWVPVVLGAGVMQISSIIDTMLGSLLAPGAVALLGYAQLVAILPVSLFGISVAAAALPEMSRAAATEQATELRRRLATGGRRVAFFIIPSAATFFLFGEHIIGPLFETGEFGPAETAAVAGILAFYGLAIPAQSAVRLLASGHYALGDTRTPVRIAILSVTISAASAYGFMQVLGVAGIALGAALGASVNSTLNYITLARRTGTLFGPEERKGLAVSLLGAAAAAGAGWGVQSATAEWALWPQAMSVLLTLGVVYLSVTTALRHPDALTLRLGRRGS
jgi:putative peptidoglycan lipid II flippase